MGRKHITELDKGRIIGWSEGGKSIVWIARKLGRGRATISVFLKNYRATGKTKRASGSGSPRKTTKREDRAIVRLMRTDRGITAQEIINQLGLNISQETVRRRLHKFGYASYFKKRTPFINQRNRGRRIQWAKDHMNWTHQQWMTVLWSDESPFTLGYKGRTRIWAKWNERHLPCCTSGTVKHGVKIDVWGCFTGAGTGHLCKVEGILKQRQYRSILRHHMIPSSQHFFPQGPWIFQQDNDPKHTAYSIRRWTRRRHLTVMEWPAQSPDLNPIENLWAIVDKNESKRQCTNAADLFDTMKRAWEQIPTQTLVNLVRSMPKRCKLVIKTKGYPIKY